MKKFRVSVYGATYCQSKNTFASEIISADMEGKSEDDVLTVLGSRKFISMDGLYIPIHAAAKIVIAEVK